MMSRLDTARDDLLLAMAVMQDVMAKQLKIECDGAFMGKIDAFAAAAVEARRVPAREPATCRKQGGCTPAYSGQPCAECAYWG